MSIADTYRSLPKAAQYGLPVVILGGAYWLKRKQEAAAAAAASSSGDSSSSPDSLQAGIDPSTGVPYAQEEAAYYDQNNDTGIGTPVMGTTNPIAPAPTPSPTPAPITSQPTNPYPVGVRVGPTNETIVQALYDPTEKLWLDLTSEGGVYTSKGGVSGSAFAPNRKFSSGGLTLLTPTTFRETDTSKKAYGPYTVKV